VLALVGLRYVGTLAGTLQHPQRGHAVGTSEAPGRSEPVGDRRS
jgi:hypothetical protein